MIQAVERTQPQRLLHLGDLLSDAEELRHVFPDLPLTGVPGNCDGWTGAMEERLLTLEGHRLLLGHGHQWGVKSSPAGACRAARMEGARVRLKVPVYTTRPPESMPCMAGMGREA